MRIAKVAGMAMRARFAALAIAACTFVPSVVTSQPGSRPSVVSAAKVDSIYEVFAVRYASLPFRVSGLIAGADTSRRLDIAMMVWVLKRPDGSAVLVDAGFYREPLMTQWKPIDYLRPDSAVATMGITPARISDVVVSHVHWDHFDGADLFTGARVWMQREEAEHHVDSAGGVRNRAINGADARMLHAFRESGRLMLIEGDGQQILPGIRVFTGGKHTFASQYVSVRTAQGVVVIASDNAYLYENLDKRLPIAQTLDAASNLAAQARMMTIASPSTLIVPGHDPLVFRRFPLLSPRVARIR